MKFRSRTCRVMEFLQNQPRACLRVMKTSVKSSVLPCNVNRSLLAQFVNSRRLDGSTNYPSHLTEIISDDILAKIIIVYKRILPKVVKSFNLLDWFSSRLIAQAMTRLYIHVVAVHDSGCWLNKRWNCSLRKNVVPTLKRR